MKFRYLVDFFYLKRHYTCSNQQVFLTYSDEMKKILTFFWRITDFFRRQPTTINMKEFSLLIMLFFFVSSVYSQDCDCDHWITPDMTFFDGSTVLPGEIVCVSSGIRAGFRMKNLTGTSDAPIQVVNCGGQVVIHDMTEGFGISIDHCSYFSLSGTGDADEDFGFSIATGYANGLMIRQLSHDFELDHLSIANVNSSAIIIKDNPNCELTANEGYFTMENISLHDLKIDNCAVGIEIGHPKFRQGVVHPFCEMIYPYAIENLVISQCEITNITLGNGISLYGCSGEVDAIKMNDIAGYGILMQNECHIKLERNEIINTDKEGALAKGGGEHLFYSNLFIDNGAEERDAVLIEFLGAAGDSYENSMHFMHNTVINSGRNNLRIEGAGEASGTCLIESNIFCEPLSIAEDGFEFSPYYHGNPQPLIHVSHNSTSDDKEEMGFVDVMSNDFQLTHLSPAVNAGNESFLNEDILHHFRNLAGAPDAGAYEYIPESIAYFGEIDLVGLYVDDFKSIIGNPAAETDLLEFAKDNGFNYLLLYNLSYIHTHLYDLTLLEEANVIANFIERAKTDYGIVQVGAVGEKNESFDKIQTFNSFYGENWFRKFDVLNLEFEFWTDPGSAVFSYYCENYMAPGGYPCTNIGAYNFYSDELELIDERAHEMGIISEIYLGYTTDLEMINLAERTDRVLLHHYRTTDTYGDGTSIYNYHTNRIHAIAQSERKPAVMPIFSSRAYHMGPWLLSHSLHQPMDTWLNGLEGYYEDETEGVSELRIAGFQWYRYTSFLDMVGGFHAPEEKPEVETPDGVSIQTNFNSQTRALSITQEIDMPIIGSSCEIYSSTGALVLVSSWNEVSHQIDLSNLSGGVYFLLIKEGNGEQFCRKISVF